MNLLQIKQRMLELAIGDKYMADCCGVGERYLKQCLMGSKPMTKVLEQKIKGVFKTLEIKKHKEEMEKEQLDKDMEYIFDIHKVDETTNNIQEPPLAKLPEHLQTKDYLRGRISGLKRACEICRSKITDEALIRGETVSILLGLDDELQSICEDVLKVV